MSWKILNEILGLASIDQEFCRKLLDHPIEAIKEKGFTITREEREVLSTIQARDISDFSGHLLNRLPPPKTPGDDAGNH